MQTSQGSSYAAPYNGAMTPDDLLAQTVERYTKHINPYLARLMNFAGFGVEVEAQGCMIRDHEGREYLDFLGGYGVFALGHRHPKVVEAVKKQLDKMPLGGKTFFNSVQAELAERLAEIAPGELEFSFFSNSGAEAVEAALKFAKVTTHRSKIVAAKGGFHGKTIGALSTTGRDNFRTPFEPLMPGVAFVPFGDLEASAAVIDDQTAAVLVEPIQGEGGIRIPPAGYLSGLKEQCQAVGALLVADEVQTGLGRTGTMFGCDPDRVQPDIMTLAKSLGGGVMPIGATVFTQQICDAVFSKTPLAHTSTFGGNGLACAAGIATLDVIQSEGLAERSRTLGERLKGGLLRETKGSELIAEVRGRGLMVGLEFAIDEVGELVIAQMVKRGLVAAYTLNNPRVIRFEPPLIVSEEQIDHACQVVGEAVQETADLLRELV